jgi:broad specificity phosphatase PhoE
MNACRRTDIYVVRHAHVHNPDDILYGRLPRFRLSELGLVQANKLAAFLAGRPIEAIYSSPLLRARQTAGTIAQGLPGVPVRRSSLILEVRTGYEGEPNSILQPGFSFYEPLVRETDESMEAVYARVSRFLRRIAQRHTGESVVAVTHADPIAIMRLGLLGLPFSVSNLHSTVYPARASINLVTLTPEQNPVLTYFNVSGERL